MKKFKLYFAYYPFEVTQALANPDTDIVEEKTIEKAIKKLKNELGSIEVFTHMCHEVK